MAVRDLVEKVTKAGNTVRRLMGGEMSASRTTEDVLRAEYQAIWGEALPQENVEATYRREVQARNQAALCLSGGGIRSAAFSLGVLKVLARHKLLTEFHYLSTVSGGGYIGGWLSRWIADTPEQNAADVEEVLGRPEEILRVSNLRANSNFLTPKTGITSADLWTGILLWVRNVLLNWTVFIPALLFAVLAPNLYLAVLTWVATLAPVAAQGRTMLFGQDLAVVLLWIGGVGLIIATLQAIRNIPSHRTGNGFSGRQVGWLIVTPLALWVSLVPLVLVAGGYKLEPRPEFQMFGRSWSILTWLLAFSFGAKVIGYLIAAVINPRNLSLYVKNFLTWVIVAAIATAALWFAIWVIDELSTFLPEQKHLLMLAEERIDPKVAAFVFLLAILGPLGANLAHLLLSTLYVGFRSVGFLDDADREWLARLSAVSVFPALLWAIFATICLFLPFVFIENQWLKCMPWGPTIDKFSKVLGVVSGLFAVLGGKSAMTKLDVTNGAPKSGGDKIFDFAVWLASLIFIAFLFSTLAYVERVAADALVGLADEIVENYKKYPTLASVLLRLLVFLVGFVPVYLLWYVVSRWYVRFRSRGVLFLAVLALAVFSGIGFFADSMGSWIAEQVSLAHDGKIPVGQEVLIAQGFIAAGLFLIITIAAMKIDVNRFSMHGVYRNRLVRAFLGGARASRAVDPFTDFDAADNRRVIELKAQKDGRRVLYPVINVTLNLVGGENLAWQERKASSFVITPFYCGSAILGDKITEDAPANSPQRWTGAYIKTQDYGSNEPDSDFDSNKTGISLGTAITISGAAASPSMGYNSSPATAFLMTLFNVRLGAWLANPAADIPKEAVKAGPTSALKPLLTEALGLTDAKSDNVYLSDGGHFDNLGIYEMIRRRCRYILVVDADADENFGFDDLARSVRFAAIDLDAKIEFTSMEMVPAQKATEQSAMFAVGHITYAESPGQRSVLVYLKPTYYALTAPIDVRSYGTTSPTFPHETTLDQWFGEAQFESYRRLGEYLMSKLYDTQLPKMQPNPAAAGGADRYTVKQFFAAASSS